MVSLCRGSAGLSSDLSRLQWRGWLAGQLGCQRHLAGVAKWRSALWRGGWLAWRPGVARPRLSSSALSYRRGGWAGCDSGGVAESAARLSAGLWLGSTNAAVAHILAGFFIY